MQEARSEAKQQQQQQELCTPLSVWQAAVAQQCASRAALPQAWLLMSGGGGGRGRARGRCGRVSLG